MSKIRLTTNKRSVLASKRRFRSDPIDFNKITDHPWTGNLNKTTGFELIHGTKKRVTIVLTIEETLTLDKEVYKRLGIL